MANCPRCGSEVATPVKTWPIPSRRPLKEGEEHKLTGIFECPNCKARFRSVVEVERETSQTTSIRNMVERIRSIKGEFMQTLVNLREKIRTLETERASLMAEIEKLREAAEARANSLESEVSTLRDEVKSLRNLLGCDEQKQED